MPSFAAPLTRLRRIGRNLFRLLSRRFALLSFTSLPSFNSVSSPTKLQRPSRSSLTRVLLIIPLLVALIAAAILLPRVLHHARSAPPDPILPPTFNAASISHHASPATAPLRIILIVQPFAPPFTAPTLIALIDSLAVTAYDNDRVHLHIVLAPHANASSFNAAHKAACTVRWPHGPHTLENATSGGLFEQITTIWTPAPRARDAVLLVEAARTAPLPPQWYRYLKSARRRYHDTADVAGFALEPVLVRQRLAHPLIPTTSRFTDVRVEEGGAGEDVFLYANLPLVSVFSPASPDIWRAFQRWFLAYRAEWFLWPTVVAPKDKRDPTWNGYRGTARAHWTLWFSRFCAQHALYTVYPRRARPAPLPPVGRASALPPLPRFAFDGSRVSDSDAVSSDSLRRIVELGRVQGGSILLTVVNEPFLETARSWLCNVETAGFRPPGIVWIATDDTAYNALRDIRGSVAVRMQHFRGATSRTGTSYGTPGYWLLMLERTMLIRDVLDAGVGVFAFETDQVWLRDPVPFVRRVVRSGDEVDVVGTLDTRHEIGGNFLFLNPTLATRRLWREVSRRFSKEYRVQGMAHHTARWRRYMENDQSTLTKLIFFDAEFKAHNPVVFRALDTDLFVDGRWYDKSHKYYTSLKSQSPIMVNNNFMIGIGNKKNRAIENGHWFVKDGKCDAQRVKQAVAENERRGEATGLGVAELQASSVKVNGSVSDGESIRARRVEGGDVEAGLDAALIAMAKEQVR